MRRVLMSAFLAAGLCGCSSDLKVSELDPQHGAYTGGEEVVIKGNGFQPGRGGVTVKFGRKEATAVAVASASQIKVMTPAGDKSSTVDVSVVFDDGRAFLIKNGFHYVDTTQQADTMRKALGAMANEPVKKPGETAPPPPAPPAK